MTISPVRRREILDALRRGTVPAGGLDALAVGLDRFVPTVDAELDACAGGGAAFKAVRGEYGSGKTFYARWIQQRALAKGFAVAEVQISELETPLHKLETVYRRICESLRTVGVCAVGVPASGRRLAVRGGGGRRRCRRHRPGNARNRLRHCWIGVLVRSRLRPRCSRSPCAGTWRRRTPATNVPPRPSLRGWPVSRMLALLPNVSPVSAATSTTSWRWASCRVCSRY